MIDPYIYKDAITVPKLLVHGTNDPYWPQDALNTYWDDLKGDKYVCYVPNAGHGLQQEDEKGKKETVPMRAVNTLAAFGRSQVFDTKMPSLTWGWKDDNLAVAATGVGTVNAIRVWKAESDTRDFRKSRWKVKAEVVPGDLSGSHSHTDRASLPEKGYSARFVEFEFKTDAGPLYLTTQIQILEAKK